MIAHTSALDPATLAAARALLYEVFVGDDAMTEDDWEHCLGGIHALAYDGDRLVGHAAVVMRRLMHDGRALRCGYVEGVAVHPSYQRRGIGGALMDELDPVVRGGYDLGALGATEAADPALHEPRLAAVARAAGEDDPGRDRADARRGGLDLRARAGRGARSGR